MTQAAIEIDSEAARLRTLLERAGQHAKRGELDRATALYEAILEVQPTHFEALHLSGVVALKAGNAARAVELMKRSIAVDARKAVAHFNLGVALRALGRLEDALASYEEAIARNPRLAAALNNRGLILTDLGRFDAALASFDRATAILEGFAEGHFNRGVVYQKLRRPDLALASYERAIELRPDFADAHFNRGDALRLLGRIEEAAASYEAAVAANPAHVAALVNRGNLLKNQGRPEAALASYDRALALEPTDVEAHLNRGVLLHESNRLKEAIAAYDRALVLRPGFAAAIQYRGYARLATGDYETGWADLEARWRNEHGPIAGARRLFEQPLWLGQVALAGKRILLHGEQGLGDTLQFCRYAKSLADRGATVILEVPEPLVGLLGSLDGVAQLVPYGDLLPPFDLHCPLMSLPLAFRTTLSTIPACVPYLAADRRKVLEWSQRLGERRRLRVGLVWSGGFRPQQPELWPVNRRRNIPLAKLAPLAHTDAQFFSLQKGDAAEAELAGLIAQGWNGPQLTDHSSLLTDFSDTAALVEQLDLVIAVDTSTAHLAGALGKPVWILNRFDSCWRWLLDRTDSPWYPTVRLYRQDRPGDWDSVVQRVRVDLDDLARSRA
ncbi:MAG TPA: tetratricopeptide repeat protein [Steroidobacteraceae bacterium]|nr:tetratricopeptide repeat protein [Steroidobacteraceae bacterium]